MQYYIKDVYDRKYGPYEYKALVEVIKSYRRYSFFNYFGNEFIFSASNGNFVYKKTGVKTKWDCWSQSYVEYDGYIYSSCYYVIVDEYKNVVDVVTLFNKVFPARKEKIYSSKVTGSKFSRRKHTYNKRKGILSELKHNITAREENVSIRAGRKNNIHSTFNWWD